MVHFGFDELNCRLGFSFTCVDSSKVVVNAVRILLVLYSCTFRIHNETSVAFTCQCVEGTVFLIVPMKLELLSHPLVSLCYQLYKMQAKERLGY